MYMGYRLAASDPTAATADVVRIRDGSITGAVLDVINVSGPDFVVAVGDAQPFVSGLFVEIATGSADGGLFLATPRDPEPPRIVGTSPIFTTSTLLVSEPGALEGFRLAATADGSPSSTVRFRDGAITGPILADAVLYERESRRADGLRLVFSSGLFVEVVGGAQGVATFTNSRDAS